MRRITARRFRKYRGRGFTLMETSLAVVIIGVGVLALLEAQQAFLYKNAWSTQSTTATLLASEIREMTRIMPRHDRFSGGLYWENPESETGFQGWGPEAGETQASDFDDLDDLDGVMFGDAAPSGLTIDRRLPGPVDAFSELITETLWNGDTATDENGDALSMDGWSQFVEVSKVSPDNFTLALADDAQDSDRPLDEFPVRVTVTVYYQSQFDAQPEEVTQASWVVLP